MAGRAAFLRSGVILLGLMLCLALAAGCARGSAASDDVADVYCLSAAQRSALVDAAVVLGLAKRGSEPDLLVAGGTEMTLDTWRQRRHDDFRRGCAALIGATQPAQSPGPGALASTLRDLVGVVLGGVLTWLAGEWRAKAATGRLEADALRSSVRAYVSAVTAHIDTWANWRAGVDRPDTRPVRERHDDVDVQLRRCHILHPRWKPPTWLRAELRRLTDRAVADLDQEEERQSRASDLRPALADFETGADRVAAEVERPWRRHRSMSARPAATGR